MKYDFAPMEGITDATYRKIHHKYFPGIHRYFMPFISPTQHRKLSAKELRELPPADTVSFTAVPQLLGKNPEDILWAIQECKNLGYQEVNLNFGCPSGTVVSKGKGSGMLIDLDQLDCFLYDIFSRSSLPVSIKTRIGVDSPDEFPEILQVYQRYPISELIIHPRVRKDFYQGACNLDAIQYALDTSTFPIVYNGNLNLKKDIAMVSHHFPKINSLMIGRGFLANPALISPVPLSVALLEEYVTELEETYAALFSSRKNAIFRMKENWRYLISMFEGSDKLWKQMRKTTDYTMFHQLEIEILHHLPLREEPDVTW